MSDGPSTYAATRPVPYLLALVASQVVTCPVRYGAAGAFACTLADSADETVYIRAITAQGASVLGERCVVAHSNSDAATWSA